MNLAVSATNLSSGKRLSRLFILNEVGCHLPLDPHDDGSLVDVDAVLVNNVLKVLVSSKNNFKQDSWLESNVFDYI